MVIIAMFISGLLIGIAGAGGSGFQIAILVKLFNVPIHSAIGTSLTAMFFTTLSGALSHSREGNAVPKLGLLVGLSGSLGGFLGGVSSKLLPEEGLSSIISILLILSGILVWYRTRKQPEKANIFKSNDTPCNFVKNTSCYLKTSLLGISTGFLSGIAGIGSAPFIQLGLLWIFHLPLIQVVGTTMIIIVPIALTTSLTYALNGNVDLFLLINIIIGSTAGSYIGAKITRFLPNLALRLIIVGIPLSGAAMLIFK